LCCYGFTASCGQSTTGGHLGPFCSRRLHDQEPAASRKLQVLHVCKNNAMAGAPASAEFGQGRSQGGRSQLGERRCRCLHRFLCASPRPATLRVRSALAVCCQQDRSRLVIGSLSATCAQGQFTSSLLQCQPAAACRQTGFHHSPWGGIKWEVE
jgi:hypothetical protein